MASKIVVFTLLLSIYTVQSQICGSSNLQQSCPSQIQYQPSFNDNGLSAFPDLQIVPGKNCNLQAITRAPVFSTSPNQQCFQTVCNDPQQDFQFISTQIPSSCSQCPQSQPYDCTPSIPIPPSYCTTVDDYSLSKSLANALELLIANCFVNSAICKVNQDTCPYAEKFATTCDLSSFVKSLNADQCRQYQCLGPSAYSCCPPNEDCVQLKTADWNAILNYLNSQCKDPEYDCRCLGNCGKQKGKSACQITKYPQECFCSDQQYIQKCARDIDCGPPDAFKAYVGNSGDTCSDKFYGKDFDKYLAEVVIPSEIPALLVGSYGYMPSTVPAISFDCLPVGDSNCRCFAGSRR